MKAVIILPVAAALATVSSAPSAARSVSFLMRCHEMIGGVPSPDETLYRLVGFELYRDDVLISREGTPVRLSVGNGESRSGVHRLDGNTLVRSVLIERRGRAPRRMMTERFDFEAQTIRDAAGRDSCHATGPR